MPSFSLAPNIKYLLKIMKQIRDKKGKFANALTEKNIKLGKIVLASLTFIILISVFYNLTEKTVGWFRTNTILFRSPVTISFTNPVEVISLQELNAREAKTALINQISDDVIKQYLNPVATPEAKKVLNLNIVKEVKATSNYTYENYSKKPFYNIVLNGIKERYTNWEDVAELQAREGGFDPGAINPTSGACGLPQALPCKKMKCSLTDIDCQLDWQKEYISNRYGTAEKALQFRISNGWY